MDEPGPAPTPRYRRVVGGSTAVAQEMGHSYVGVEHLFLATIRDRGAVPTQVLATLIDLDRVEAALLAEMASAAYRGEKPPPAGELPAGCTTRALPPPSRTGSAMDSSRPWPRICRAVASPG